MTSSENRVLEAAISLFGRLGFNGTTTRGIAKRSGFGVASMYHHFPSKYDILVRILDSVMTGLYEDTSKALATAPDDAVSRLRAIVHAHCLFHMTRQVESFITNSEIRSLNAADRRAHIAARDKQQRLFDEVVRQGVEDGVFATEHPVEASRAIVTMCTAVAGWFRTDGPLSREEVADRYVDLALGLVRGAGPGRTD